MRSALKTHIQADAYSSPSPLARRLALLAWDCAWTLTCAWTPKPLNAWRLIVLRVFGARIHGRPFVHQRARIQYPWNLTLHHRACLGDRAHAYALDRIMLHCGATIAQEVYLCTGTHDFTQAHLPLQTAPIVVGRDAFVGARAFVLPGVTLGADCIVGAVEAAAIVAGNPARPIGRRALHTAVPGQSPISPSGVNGLPRP
jgi:putative colanic acid biosynthesis acetyltransferase WcaF